MKLTDRIHLVGSGANGFGLTDSCDSHVYLVDGGSEMALIDAGAGRDPERILHRIDATGLARDAITSILVTHAHADHAGGAGGLRSSLGAAVLASDDVAEILEAGDASRASVDIGVRAGTYPDGFEYQASQIDRRIGDGERVQIGDVEIEVLSTPGHAVGHLCFILHADGRSDLFSGDMLLFGGNIILQDTWDCDLRASIMSVRRLAAVAIDGFFPGHFSFSVEDGTRHLLAAAAPLSAGGVPPHL